MDKNNKMVTIEGRKYKLIEGTQGDGRCFSASIYYSLFGHIAISDELNDWIQVNIINPIVKENNYDYRGDLFVWAFNLYSLNNVDSTNTNTNNTIVVDNLVEQLDNVFKLLTPLVMFKNKLKCQNENIVYENILYDITKLIDDVGYFNTHQPNNFTQEYIETAYNEIIKILNELVNYELEIIENFSDEILPVSEITNLSIDKVNDIIDKICNIIQNNIPEYDSIMNSYILYIEKLNIDQQTNKKSKIQMYEWTEPLFGPASILILENKKIKSITIYTNAKMSVITNIITKKNIYAIYFV